MENKIVTFISRHAPYGTDHATACLDMVLAFSIFDQQVNYYFVDDGIYQLLPSQQAEEIDSKSLVSSLGALELYGVHNVYVDADSIASRSIKVLDLGIKARVIHRAEATEMLVNSDHVFVL